jgi:hypothetical protein
MCDPSISLYFQIGLLVLQHKARNCSSASTPPDLYVWGLEKESPALGQDHLQMTIPHKLGSKGPPVTISTRQSQRTAMLLAGFVRKSELGIGHDMGPIFRTNHDLCNATTCCLRLGPWSSASSLTTPAAALRIPRSIPASSIKGMSTVHAVWWSKKNVKLAEVPLTGKPAGKSYVTLKPTQSYNYFCWLRV